MAPRRPRHRSELRRARNAFKYPRGSRLAVAGAEGSGTAQIAIAADPPPKAHGEPFHLSTHGEPAWWSIGGAGDADIANGAAVADPRSTVHGGPARLSVEGAGTPAPPRAPA